MEAVVFEDSPLAEYLEGEGESEGEWAPAKSQNSSPTSSPRSSFAPRGNPAVQLKFRNKLPPPLRLSIHPNPTAKAIHNAFSRSLNSRLGRADNAKFLEQFRYIIVASQLLNKYSYHGRALNTDNQDGSVQVEAPKIGGFTLSGVFVTAAAAFALAWMIHWARGGRTASATTGRVTLVVTILAVLVTFSYTYVRKQWLQYLRQQTLAETTEFITKSQGLDAVTAAAMTLIQEVELVSRGYRISSPLPPITRLEDRSQNKRCIRLRKALQGRLAEMLPRYNQACLVLKPLAELIDLEKYFDVYDISALDLQEASLGYSDTEFDDAESLRVLKILVARFHTIRKVLLCCLLALDADGGKPDFFRWSTTIDEMHALTLTTGKAEYYLRKILDEEQSFPVPPTPKLPITPGREKWRAQLRKLNTLSSGVRSLQAKMHVLREESDKALDETEDLTDLGPNLMLHYEAIGVDLRALVQEWEDGKLALLSNIDKNEKRLSSLSATSGMMSPTLSLGGLTSVEEGSPLDALKTLNGEDPFRRSLELSSSDAEEVFEAVALPRQRSALSREERIMKMKEERSKRESRRETIDSNTHMLRELESVINLRQRPRGMLEARLEQANLLKKVVDSIKDLVQDCNFDCNDSGIALQAMDNSHVALVSMMLKADGFSPYRCDRNVALGVNLTSLTKVLRAAQNEDILTLKAEDAPDVLNLVFESSESDRLSEYDLKLMDIDQEHLGIPETEYAATIGMPSNEFKRICMDLMALSESVTIKASKDGVEFSCKGDIGNGSVTLRSHTNVEKPELNVDIDLTEPVELTFSLKYLVNFCKASGLSSSVKLCLSNEVPLLVEYNLTGSSYLRFYLAPKIGDEE